MKFTKVASGVVALGMAALTMTACGSGRGSSKSSATSSAAGGSGASSSAGAVSKGALIGVAMPTKVSERWIADGNAVKADLEKAGYKVDLEYGNNNIPTQVQQVGNMITKGAKVLIIASIDGGSLSDQLDLAGKKGIKVISYDRLLTGNKNVDYYVSFDNFRVGVLQANSLLTGLGVLNAAGKPTGAKGPFNVELFAGSPDDNNATLFFNGAMSVLQSYISKGTLVVKSGQTKFTQGATLRWDPATAKARMQNLIAKSYSGGATVQGVLSPYDGLSLGIISALTGAGYGTGSKKLPIITGQDAEVPSLKSVLAGQQYSTIFKDTRKLGHQAALMTDDLLNGKTPTVNNTTTYNNKVKVVPSYLFQPVVVTKANVKSTVIASGYHTQAELNS